ncbi:MAG: transglycosylase SLT domain-containing protein [bacterium]
MNARVALAAAALAVAAAALSLLLGGDQSNAERAIEVATGAALDSDPLAWNEGNRAELEQRAATGTSEVIYANSPDGVVATAERTEAWRRQVERAAERRGVDPDRLEALVFLESAGRPEVIAGETPEAASGLTQITPSAATDLLEMRVDLEVSTKLTKQIARATADGKTGLAARLAEKRAKIDQRFDPGLALDGAARYLQIAGERFGATDLATESYHMGIGNLESVIRAYTGASGDGPIGDLVSGDGLSYAQLYFDSSPSEHAEAYDLLSGLGDDSSEYYWKILASERIMELWRDDRSQLERTAALATAKATLEEVYHPESETEVFEALGDVRDATDAGELLPLFDASELGWIPDSQMGELAPELGEEPGLYRGLRPEALATLAYMAAAVKRISGAQRPLRVTSSVRDQAYQDLLVGSNPEATQAYSLHTTGYAFDVLRDYANDRQAAAFQFMLDRLQALAVIDYAVEPRAIHVTVSDLGSELVPP